MNFRLYKKAHLIKKIGMEGPLWLLYSSCMAQNRFPAQAGNTVRIVRSLTSTRRIPAPHGKGHIGVRPITSTELRPPANLSKDRSHFSGSPEDFHPPPALMEFYQGQSKNQGRTRCHRCRKGQDHVRYADLGGSPSQKEASRAVHSRGMRCLRQSPPWMVLLSGQRRSGRS